MSGWPGLNLRNFMAHLAPGVYFSLQFAILFLFAASFVDPSVLQSVLKINQVSTPVGAFLGLVLLTVCYFVGVVLRLVTVDHVDVQSLDYNLRKELLIEPIESTRSSWLRRLSPVPNFWWFLRRLASELLPAAPKEITVREARQLLKGPSTEMEQLERMLRAWQTTSWSMLREREWQAAARREAEEKEGREINGHEWSAIWHRAKGDSTQGSGGAVTKSESEADRIAREKWNACQVEQDAMKNWGKPAESWVNGKPTWNEETQERCADIPKGTGKSNDEKREKSNKDIFMELEDEYLRVAVIQYAIHRLLKAEVLTLDANGAMAAASPAGLWDHISTWVKDEKVIDYAWWFAACDSYPYPIRLLYRNWHRADAPRRDELAKYYVPLILETIVGEWPGARYTHGPINRAKECVIASPNHAALSALVYEREALTRMVAGFFPALRFGLCTSLLLTPGCLARLFGPGWVRVGPGVWTEWMFFTAGVLALLLCNGWLLARVLANLRSIRYGEVDTVLEAYLLVKFHSNPGST